MLLGAPGRTTRNKKLLGTFQPLFVLRSRAVFTVDLTKETNQSRDEEKEETMSIALQAFWDDSLPEMTRIYQQLLEPSYQRP